MESSALIIAEMLITLGVCLGFGFWQLWDLRRERIKDVARTAAKETAAKEAAAKEEAARAASAGEGARPAVRLSSDAAS